MTFNDFIQDEVKIYLGTVEDAKKEIEQKRTGTALKVLEKFAEQTMTNYSGPYILGMFCRIALDDMESCKNRLAELIDKNQTEDTINLQKSLNKSILDLVQVFKDNDGDDETVSMIFKLGNFKPLTPLTGDDSEWIGPPPGVEDDGTLQNKRCPSIFKEKDGKVKYLEKYVITDDGGLSWFTSDAILEKLNLDSSITFPYLPTTDEIYIRYPHDVPSGEISLEFEVITDDPEAIKALREQKLASK